MPDLNRSACQLLTDTLGTKRELSAMVAWHRENHGNEFNFHLGEYFEKKWYIIVIYFTFLCLYECKGEFGTVIY